MAEEGWGVIDSPATPGGCWAHFSSVLVAGYRTFAAGQEVTFDYETAEQDGYRFRAIEVWPAGQEPEWSTIVVPGPTAASQSTLIITFDDPEEPDHP